MALNEAAANFLAEVVGDSDYWPDHEKHVYHINLSRIEANNYLFASDSDMNSRISENSGVLSIEGQHSPDVTRRVYVFVATDSGVTPTITDPENLINPGLGD